MVRNLVALTLVALMALSACEEKAPQTPKEEPAKEEAAPAEVPVKEEPAKEEAATPEAAPEGTQWVETEKYGVKFRVPDDWQVKRDGDNVSVTSPDSTMTVLMVGTESDGLLQTALENIKKQVTFKDVNLKRDAQTVLNGMPGYTAQGSAVLVKEGGDQEIEFLMNSVRTGDKGVAMMLFSEAEMYEAKKEEFEGIGKTLQKR